MSDTSVSEAKAKATEEPPFETPFWGLVNGKPLKIRTMAATGPFGSGKSLLGDMIDTHNTLKVDVESSSTAFNLPFKKHLVMYDEVKSKFEVPQPIECFEWFRDLIMAIKPGEYTVVSVDPINELQAGAYDWVYEHPEKFGRTKGQYDKMTAMVWGDVKTYLDQLVGMLSSKIETFYYTLHMGQVWKLGKPVDNQVKAKGSDVFRKMADVVFVLDRPLDPRTGKQVDAPIGITAPPIGKSRLVHADPDTGIIKPILPPAIHGLTPAKIRAYIAKPPDYAKLKKDEVVPQHVMSDDERLQLQAQIAENNLAAEQARMEQLQGAKTAAQENALAIEKAKKAAAKTESAAKAETGNALDTCEKADFVGKSESVGKEANTAALPTQAKQGEADWKYNNLSIPDRITVIKEQMVDLGLSREQMVAAIEKRAGMGKKMTDMTEDQLIDLHKALWNKLTQRDMEKK